MNNVLQMVWLIPFLPLLGFLINGLGRNKLGKNTAGFIGCGVILVSFALSIWAFWQVNGGNTHTANYFSFLNLQSLQVNFAFKIDQLSAIFLLIITGVGFLIHVYSTSYMQEENAPDFAKYFSYLNLFVFSMLLLVMGSNFVIMFIGWEGVGLCSYLLIGYWFKNRNYTAAAKKAFVMNRIGDLGFLLALFWMVNKTGSTEFSRIFSPETLRSFSSTDITFITLFLFVGATGKSAQIPLYTWLPDAMAGPTPVSALIHAATMVTAGIYMIARSNTLYSLAHSVQWVIAIVGLATALLAASIALRQNDIKKVLAYSTVSQLGFMFIAIGCGNYTAAVFHVMTHAFFKALLFLGSGSVIHSLGGEQDIMQMGGLRKYMRITYITFLIGCLAIAGIPPFSGFFSKDAILLSAYEHNKVIWVFAVLGAMMTSYYMFRLFFVTFTGSFRGSKEQEHHLHESPAPMTIPLMLLAVLAVIGGMVGIPHVLGGHNQIGEFLQPVIPAMKGHTPVPASTEWALMGGTTALMLASIALAWYHHRKVEATENTGFAKVLENKWYVDELFEKIIGKPLQHISLLFNNLVERKGIDGLVNGVGRAVNYGSRQLRLLQSGNVGLYILFMVLGVILFFVLQLFLNK